MSARSLLRATATTTASSNPKDATSSNPILQDPLISIHPKTKSIRCIACDYQVIKHFSLWSSHCQSKPHRQGVAKMREKEEKERRKKEEEEQEERLKQEQRLEKERLEKENEAQREQEKERISSGKGKRKAVEDVNGEHSDEAKKSKSIHQEQDQDEEWLAFQREVLGNDGKDSTKASAIQPLYNPATIMSEPQLNVKTQKSGESQGGGEGEAQDGDEEDGEPEETEEEKRKRLDREEKEEIYQRYMEEIRSQDEVDERVNSLKTQVELLKSKKATPSSSKSQAAAPSSTSTAGSTPSSSRPSIKVKPQGKSTLAAAMAMAARRSQKK